MDKSDEEIFMESYNSDYPINCIKTTKNTIEKSLSEQLKSLRQDNLLLAGFLHKTRMLTLF